MAVVQVVQLSAPALAENAATVVPVPMTRWTALWPRPEPLLLRGHRYWRKVELHVTAINATTGVALDAILSTRPALKAACAAALAGHVFTMRVSDELVAVDRPASVDLGSGERKAELHTIVVLVDVDLPGLYAELARLVAGAGASIPSDLAMALGEPPPAHVTLYTTDPAGEQGIRLSSRGQLDEALARGRGERIAAPTTTLSATVLESNSRPSVICGRRPGAAGTGSA